MAGQVDPKAERVEQLLGQLEHHLAAITVAVEDVEAIETRRTHQGAAAAGADGAAVAAASS